MYQEENEGEVCGCSCGHLAVFPIALPKCLYCLKREEGEEGRERGRKGEGEGRREGGKKGQREGGGWE